MVVPASHAHEGTRPLVATPTTMADSPIDSTTIPSQSRYDVKFVDCNTEHFHTNTKVLLWYNALVFAGDSGLTDLVELGQLQRVPSVCTTLVPPDNGGPKL